jgi:hypothetical protein
MQLKVLREDFSLTAPRGGDQFHAGSVFNAANWTIDSSNYIHFASRSLWKVGRAAVCNTAWGMEFALGFPPKQRSQPH